eukprot:551065_1
MSSDVDHVRRRESQIVFTSSFAIDIIEAQAQPLPESQTSIAQLSSPLPTFDYYTDFLKQVIEKVYEIEEIADIVYSTIITSKYDTDDILDDISSKTDSWIVTKISTKIIENDDIGYGWNDEDNNNLSEILTMVYKDSIMDIHRYDKMVFKVDAFTEKVIKIAKDINKKMRKPMAIPKLRQLLEKEKLNEASMRNITQDIMEQKAIKYDIKPHYALKILHRLQAQMEQDTDQKEREFSADEKEEIEQPTFTRLDRSFSVQHDDDDWRDELDVGSRCLIYSKSGRVWTQGQVIDVSEDQDGEWLLVQYVMDNIRRSKELRREDNFIRQLSEDDDDLPVLHKVKSLPIVEMNSMSPLHMISPSVSAMARNVSWNQNITKRGHDRGESRIDNKAERLDWEVGIKCETFLRSQNRWMCAEIIKLFTHYDKEWMLLKCLDNTLVEVERFSDSIRAMPHACSAALHKRHKSAAEKAMFDHIMMESLMRELKHVLESINHQIDANRKFLYQIYHIERTSTKQPGHTNDTIEYAFDDQNVRKFVTYESEKAMAQYHEVQKERHPTVLLCNGLAVGSYGDRTRCIQCEEEGKKDYGRIKLFVHDDLLNVDDICDNWTHKYDQKQLLSMQREDVIAQFTDPSLFNIPTIQIAIALYDKLMASLTDAEIKTDDKKDSYSDIMFLWTKKEASIETLDGIHFLYIVSLILDEMKREFNQVDTNQILRCLYDMQINGLMFGKIEQGVFSRSVVMHSHSSCDIEMDSFKQLMACADRLWVDINEYKLDQIYPSSICNVSLSTQHDESAESKDEHEPKDVPIFEQWMTTFNSKYNRNTPFHFDVFADLIKVYEDKRSTIIDMKYDNYSMDLNKKTYDHVLKSFIAWAITLKCSKLRCNEKPKLNCFCDTETFQLYTYHIIIGLIGLKANHNYSLLKVLSDTRQSVATIVRQFCGILAKELQGNEYIESYELLVSEWINFEFYNFVCNYCRHMNKSIMIDRIYSYSKSLDSCRICSKQQISRVVHSRPQFDIHEAVKTKHSAMNELYEQHSEFTLHALNEYLSKCAAIPNGLTEYFKSEEYDSEAVIEDIEDPDASNICQIIPQYYHLVCKFLNYHQYPTYQNGKLIRYLVLRPKFFSLVKEICLNGIYPLSINVWQHTIVAAVSKEYKRKKMHCNVTDRRFGVEEGEPMGINHLISIFLFTEGKDRFQKYRRFFSKSYYLWRKVVHCNNFYWVGRYLFEAVQFYGQSFANNKRVLYKGIHKIKSFDSVALTINSPTLTTENMQMARKFATNRGCTFAVVPKYRGDVDTNSKLLDADLFNKRILLLKGTKVQLRSIQIIDPAENLDPVVLAIQYIEKILLQSTFDVHFYNTSGLYTAQNMKTAYRLIMAVVKGNWDWCVTPYLRHLFENWCFKRDFVTFETFGMEMHFMNNKLKSFLFDERTKKINIANVKKLLPNLKHYHDIDGILRNVDIKRKAKTNNSEQPPAVQSIGLLYNCQAHDIPYHIVNALQNVRYKFEKCPKVLPHALRLELSKLGMDHMSFQKDHKDSFIKQLCSIGIAEEVAAQCIKAVNSKHSKQIHARTTSDTLVDWIVEALEKQEQWMKRIECDAIILKEAFKQLYSTDLIGIFATPILKREEVTAKELYNVAKTMEIFNSDEAMVLSKYLYIKMMDDKERVRPWLCEMCHFLNCKRMVDGLWRYYNESHECGLCGVSRSKITNAMIANKQDNDDDDASKSIFYRLRKRRSTFYNEATATDTCNDAAVDTQHWEDVEDSECTLFTSVKHLSSTQLIYLVKHHFINKMTQKNRDKLGKHEEKVCTYFTENSINGHRFVQMKKKEFVKALKTYCEDRALAGPLTQLYKVMTECNLSEVICDVPECKDSEDVSDMYSDCPAYQRVKIVLRHFEADTERLPSTQHIYDRNMQQFLHLFPAYSPLFFLNDVNHMIEHKLLNLARCEDGVQCIHLRRATRDRNAKNCKTLSLKKQFFNTNNQVDFVYISMLDRAHCLLYHSDDIKNISKNTELFRQDVTKIEHIQYNTGVYMEYHTLKPLYQNLFDEIVGNHGCQISEDQFYGELESSKLFVESDNRVKNTWRACRTDAKYGIKVNEAMHIEHVLCIKFYCNYSCHCENFRKTYRRIHVSDTKDDIIRRHCNNHYWFGRFLTTAIVFWGQIPTKAEQIYHGLSGKFVFDHFSTVYEIPTSTTDDINVAQNFAESTAGIVLKLSPKYTDEVNQSRCLDVAAAGLSDFEAEREKLFAGMTVLSITNIYNPSDNEWKGYGDYVAAFLYFERIIEQTNQQKHHYNYGQLAANKQEEYLVPAIKHQMDKNSSTDQSIPHYVRVLFEYFCDSKRDYIDLSCINEEIPSMAQSLSEILFKDIKFVAPQDEPPTIAFETSVVREYKINNQNIKRIFPNLVEYKNHMSNWIYVAESNV